MNIVFDFVELKPGEHGRYHNNLRDGETYIFTDGKTFQYAKFKIGKENIIQPIDPKAKKRFELEEAVGYMSVYDFLETMNKCFLGEE